MATAFKNMNDFFVYMHYRQGDNTNPFYVGIGNKSRAYRKEGRNDIWNKIYKKHGRKVLMFAENCSRDEAFVFERMLICQYGKIHNNTGVLSNMTNGGEGGLTRAVYCDGEIYSSLASAASSLGLSEPSAISVRIKSPYYNYHYVDSVSNYSGNKRPNAGVGVIANGVEYKSVNSCAKALGMSAPGVKTRILSPRFDFKFKNTEGNYNPNIHENGFAKAVMVNGLLFKSMTDASVHFGKSLTSMFRLIKSNNINFRYATQEEIYHSSSGTELS